MKIEDLKKIEVKEPIIVEPNNPSKMKTEEQTPAEPTIEELEALLEKKKAKKAKADARARTAYEDEREHVVVNLLDLAKDASDALESFKKTVHLEMEKQNNALSNYGEIRGNSKGGFSITSKDGTLRVRRTRDTQPAWDERAEKGVQILKEFLAKTAKKRDAKLYKILMGFLEKNTNGDLEFSRVMLLLNHEAEFKNPEWVEGIKLLKEGYSNHLKGYAYLFQIKGVDDKWETLKLNFSSL